MARIIIEQFTEAFTSGDIHAVDWIIAKDKDYTKIIFESLKDTENIDQLITPLPKLQEDRREGDSEFYNNLNELYIKVRLWSSNTVSNWYEIGPKSQQEQMVPITENNKIKEEKSSYELKWIFKPFDITQEDVLKPNIINKEN